MSIFLQTKSGFRDSEACKNEMTIAYYTIIHLSSYSNNKVLSCAEYKIWVSVI